MENWNDGRRCIPYLLFRADWYVEERDKKVFFYSNYSITPFLHACGINQ
jgi:hypothetical protein